MINKIFNEDCLEWMKRIPDWSIDAIITDPPYWNMDTDWWRRLWINWWDIAISPKNIFESANRILRKNWKLILFSQEPYTSRLITEAIPNVPFSYRAIWEKDNFANALGVNVNMVSFTEDILIFSKNECYEAKHPLRSLMKEYAIEYWKDFIVDLLRKEGRYTSELSARVNTDYKFGTWGGKRFDLMNEKLYNYLSDFIDFKETFEELKQIDIEYKIKYGSTFNLWEWKKYKSNILKYKKDYEWLHPTQKPVLLLEDLIKTYTNEWETVLDFTIGSGTTAIAALNTNRNYIGFEMDKTYFDISQERITKYLWFI